LPFCSRATDTRVEYCVQLVWQSPIPLPKPPEEVTDERT